MVFTIRANKIRIFSARTYEQETRGSFMKEKVMPIPKFRKEQDERDFWNTHDTTEYFDFSKSKRVEISSTLESKLR
jgi:hypothetical protein